MKKILYCFVFIVILLFAFILWGTPVSTENEEKQKIESGFNSGLTYPIYRGEKIEPTYPVYRGEPYEIKLL